MSPRSDNRDERRLRGVIWSHDAENAINELSNDESDRIDEVMCGVEASLAYPDIEVTPTGKEGVYARTTFGVDGTPPLTVFYAFDDENVEVLDIMVSDAES